MVLTHQMLCCPRTSSKHHRCGSGNILLHCGLTPHQVPLIVLASQQTHGAAEAQRDRDVPCQLGSTAVPGTVTEAQMCSNMNE